MNKQLTIFDYRKDFSNALGNSTTASGSSFHGHGNNLVMHDQDMSPGSDKPYRNALGQLLPWEEKSS